MVIDVILDLEAAGERVHKFCGTMAIAGMEMVNRQLAFWDNPTGDAGNAPYDFDRGGPVMYISSLAEHPRIAIGHEAVHGVIRLYQGGQLLYYSDTEPRDPPRAKTPLGTLNQAAARCLRR